MNKSELKQLIREVYLRKTKPECNCGCDTCENVGNPGVVLNESLVKKSQLSEHLQYHIDNKLPLTENTFRYGSSSFLNLWAEARALYLREVIHVNEEDKEILEETDLGNYGIYEGQKVPLDLPMVNEDESILKPGLIVKSTSYEHGTFILHTNEGDIKIAPAGGALTVVNGFEPVEPIRIKSVKEQPYEITILFDNGKILSLEDDTGGETLEVWKEPISEAEYQGKDVQLNKPKRGGSKAYYVYVRDPKTKKIKKVSFGSGGLKAKINNPEARRAFAKRHNCDKKKDKTTAGYWSCRLPRYAKALGLKSSFSGYW